jgi:sugar lactone lactonase YvrE
VRAEQVTDPVAHHGEGPMWDARLGRLMWVDLLRGDLLTLRDDGSVERRHVGDVAACVVPRAGGGHVVATERGFALLDFDGDIETLPDVWDDAGVRMNDGGCDPLGRFWCGSMAYDEAPGRASMFRLDPDHTAHLAFDGVTVSNGLAWSPDGSAAYYIDSPTRRVDVCAADLTERRSFFEIPVDAGIPDGLTVDGDGGVWVALWDGSAVRHHTQDGVLDEVVELPVRRVTSCAFGGPDLDTLYISTSALGLDDPEPSAGALFAVNPGVTGQPSLEFAG